MRGVELFLLWITVIQFGNCNYADILWGQCYSVCLSRSEIRSNVKVDANNVAIPSDKLLRACRKHNICKWCLFACDRPVADYNNHNDCLSDCSNERNKNNVNARLACHESCNVSSALLKQKYGSCPAPNDMRGFKTTCVQECADDLNCDGMHKCCANGCGQICHKPVEYHVVPAVPADLQITEKNDGGIIVTWDTVKSSSVPPPIVYVLRWWCLHGQPVVVQYKFTTSKQIKLKGHPLIQPESNCNFMLAAVNIHGSAGFTKVKAHKKAFLKPSKPLNLEHVKSKEQSGEVEITIRWMPPVHTDGLPVARYKISWSGGLPRGSKDFVRLHMHRKTIPGDRKSYVIPKLQLCTVYFIQVHAEVEWKDKSLRGKSASIYTEACPGPQPANGVEFESISPVDFQRFSIYNITVHTPAFVNSKLMANVTWSVYPGSNVKSVTLYWTLDVCEGEAMHRKTIERLKHEASTNQSYFTLSHLFSDCVYELKLHAVNFMGKTDEGRTEIFRTPPCLSTKGIIVNKTCLLEATPPPPPFGLIVFFKPKLKCICQASLLWQHPVDHESRISQFIVLWGPSRPPSSHDIGVSSIVYNSPPYKIYVPGNDSRACMSYLERSKHYTVQIISQASKLKSVPAVYHYTTPDDLAPCYEAPRQNNLEDPIPDIYPGFLGSIDAQVRELSNTTATVTVSNSNSHSLSINSHIFLALCLVTWMLTK